MCQTYIFKYVAIIFSYLDINPLFIYISCIHCYIFKSIYSSIYSSTFDFGSFNPP